MPKGIACANKMNSNRGGLGDLKQGFLNLAIKYTKEVLNLSEVKLNKLKRNCERNMNIRKQHSCPIVAFLC